MQSSLQPSQQPSLQTPLRGSGLAVLMQWVQRGLGLALTIVALIAARDLPRWGTELFVAASLYLLLLIKLPRLWILLLPAFVVTVDLAPWTGRFLYNELDVILWLTIAAALICARYAIPVRGALSREQFRGLCLIGTFTVVAVSGSSGLTAIVSPPGASFVSPYLDPGYGYNVVKGLIWAALLTPLWLQLRKADAELTLQTLFAGAAIGAFALLTVILWERGSLAAFAQGWEAGLSSLINLSTDYRTIGLFSNMRTGGEALDGTIILLLSICAYGSLYARHRTVLWCSRLAVVALAYVTLVGFTRATYAAFALTLALLVALEVYRYRARLRLRIIDVVVISSLLPALFTASYLTALLGSRANLALLVVGQALALFVFARLRLRWPLRQALVPGVGMVLIPLVFALGLTAGTMGGRMQSVEKSLDTRIEHWTNVWEIGRRAPGAGLVGQGAGSFPALYQEHFPEKVSWIGGAAVDPAGGVLQLNGGGDLLFAQRVVLDGLELRVELSARAPQGGRVSVALCSRNVLDTGWWGGRCDTHILALRPGSEFQRYTLTLALPVEARTGEAASWPRALQLRNLDERRPIEISAVRGVSGLSYPLINASFNQGMDGWFFSTDFGHLPFHIKNTWLQFWFDQGWFGLMLMCGMVLMLAVRAIRGKAGQVFVPMTAVAIVSFSALGMFGTPLDSARVAWLFYLLLFAGLLEPSRFAQPTVSRMHP